MDKKSYKKLKLSEIKKLIDDSNYKFLDFLHDNLDVDVQNALKLLSSQTELYIFSGIIRNFFLGINDVRDVDVVIGEAIDIKAMFSERYVRLNSFGGYKIKINKTDIDLWNIEDTWMFKVEKNLGFLLVETMPSTAFFNFSSIIFSYSEQRFYYKTDFAKFLKNEEIDVVNKLNPNYPLCIVNSLYYMDKYHLKLSNRLKSLIVDKQISNADYSQLQLKHFGTVLYSNSEIEKRIADLWLSLSE